MYPDGKGLAAPAVFMSLSSISGMLVLIDGKLAQGEMCCACDNCPSDVSGCSASFTINFSNNSSNLAFECSPGCSGYITTSTNNTLNMNAPTWSGLLANSGACGLCPFATLQCVEGLGWVIRLQDGAATVNDMYPSGSSPASPNYAACPPTGAWASAAGSGFTFAATLT